MPSIPGKEGASSLPLKKKTKATWNVRTLNTEGKLEILINEISKFKIDIGVSEFHSNNTITEAFEQDHFTIIHVCVKDSKKRQCVAIIVKKAALKNFVVARMLQRTSPACHLRHG